MDEYFAHLQKIGWDEEFTYQDIKGTDFDIFNDFLKSGCTLKQAIRGAYYYHLQHEMDENGMAKAVHIIAGMLFEMEHQEVDRQHAYEVYMDIQDLQTGEYDYLIPAEDLPLLKRDIAKIDQYLKEHPELVKE